MRILLASVVGLVVAAAAYATAGWWCELTPLWQDRMPYRVLGFTPEGDRLITIVNGEDWAAPDKIQVRDARTGVKVDGIPYPAQDEVAFRIAAQGKLTLFELLDSPINEPQNKGVAWKWDPESRQWQRLELGPFLACELSQCGDACFLLRESAPGHRLVRVSLTDGTETTWPIPRVEEGQFHDPLLRASDNHVAWTGTHGLDGYGNSKLRLWTAELTTGRIASYEYPFSGEHVIEGLRFVGDTGLIEVRTALEGTRHFGHIEGRWHASVGVYPNINNGASLTGCREQTLGFGSVSSFPQAPRLGGSAPNGSHAMMVWSKPFEPSQPRMLAIPSCDWVSDFELIADGVLAVTIERRSDPVELLRKVGEWTGIESWTKPTFRQGVRIYDLASQQWTWESFGAADHKAIPSCAIAGQFLMICHHHDSRLSIWPYPPPTWQRWAPTALAAIGGFIAAVAVHQLRRRRSAKLAP